MDTMSNNIFKGFIDNIVEWFKTIFNVRRGKLTQWYEDDGETFKGDFIVYIEEKDIFNVKIKEVNPKPPADLSFNKKIFAELIKNNMSTEQISKNFKMSEFAVSTSASAKGHTIVIPEDLKSNVVTLVINLLQPICDATGWKDKINSGYRDEFTNNLVGGAKGSQHTKGEAADNMFYVLKDGKAEYLKPIEVLRKVVELRLDFDQMIAYPTFVHLSYTTSKQNRKQILYNSSYKGERL